MDSTPNAGNSVADSPSRDVPPSVDSLLRIVLGGIGAGGILFALLMVIRAGGHASSSQVVVYYVAPAGIGAGLLWSLRRSAEARGRLLLLIAFTVGALLICEVLLSSVSRRQGEPAPAGDTRKKAQVVLDLRAEGALAVPSLPATWLRTARLEGAANATLMPLSPSPGQTTVVFCNETGSWITYRADRHGFNNPDRVWEDTPVPLATIGDSFTHGACLPQEEHYVGVIRSVVPSIVNLGVSGSGPLHQLAILREFGPLVRPRTVLWVYFEGNDLFDLRDELQVSSLVAYLDDGRHSQELARQQAAMDAQLLPRIDSALDSSMATPAVAEQRSWGLNLTSILRLETVRQVAGFGILVPKRIAEVDDFRTIMERAQRAVAEWNGRLVFAYLPDLIRFRQRVGEGIRGRAEVLRVTRDLGIPTVDLTPAFASEEDAERLFNGPMGHYSALGNDLVAREISRLLERPPVQVGRGDTLK